MSYIKLCNVYLKFKRTSQSCSASKISQPIMLNGALVIELAFSESKKKFGRFKKRGTFSLKILRQFLPWAICTRFR